MMFAAYIIVMLSIVTFGVVRLSDVRLSVVMQRVVEPLNNIRFVRDKHSSLFLSEHQRKRRKQGL
jgi:hypothetical protein